MHGHKQFHNGPLDNQVYFWRSPSRRTGSGGSNEHDKWTLLRQYLPKGIDIFGLLPGPAECDRNDS
jgi:hypothetical protein